jgi:hypothetical protein
VNVWFTEDWIDPLSTNGNTTGEGLGQFLHAVPALGPALSPAVDAAVRATPTRGLGMKGFYDWLDRCAGARVGVRGGRRAVRRRDGLAGFNHPGRERGRFADFAYDARLAERIVSMEVFNRGEDYLFEGTDAGQGSPMVECLDAGWRVGLLGVSDEHGTDWGYPDGKGRTGLYVRELTRRACGGDAVSALLLHPAARPALRRRGQRPADGVGRAGTARGPMRFTVDVDRGRPMVGQQLDVQVLMTGSPLPTVVHTERIRVPASGQLVTFEAPVDAADGEWVVLRLTDPRQKPDGRAPSAYTASGSAIAVRRAVLPRAGFGGGLGRASLRADGARSARAAGAGGAGGRPAPGDRHQPRCRRCRPRTALGRRGGDLGGSAAGGERGGRGDAPAVGPARSVINAAVGRFSRHGRWRKPRVDQRAGRAPRPRASV